MALKFDIYENLYQPYGEWYDFATAVYDAGGDNSLYNSVGYLQLYDSGCKVDDHSWNCTAACLDTQGPGINMVWNSTNSTFTLMNCMVFPFIASLLASGNLTAHAVNLTTKYHIPANADLATNASAGWPVINNCIDAFCTTQNTTTPGCSPNSEDVSKFIYTPNMSYYNNLPTYNLPLNVTFSGKNTFKAGICNNLNAVINPDIGGIGMFVSYLMQMFIVLSAWLAFHFYQTWARWPVVITLYPFHGRERASLIAEKLQNAIKASHHTAALVSALVEFQKAQVFFMLAVQIAALIALHNPAYIQANTWQQLWNNLGILYDLAFSGSLPVLFTLVVLRLAGKRSTYMLLVSFCCIVLSAVTWFVTWYTNPDPNSTIIYNGPDLPQCGNVAPIKYCYANDWFTSNSDATPKAMAMLAFCFAVQVCLILDLFDVFRNPDDLHGQKVNCFQWLRGRLRRAEFWRGYENRVATSFRWLAILRLETGEQVLQMTHSFILLATEFVFVGLNAVLISDFAHVLLPNTFQILDLKAWTLGQVIAVTIWVPVLLEYVWLAVVGPEEGFEHRLDKEYQVVRRDTDRSDTAYDTIKIKADNDDFSSGMDLAQLQPAGRPRYERVDSDMIS